jgi:hypothetical protein
VIDWSVYVKMTIFTPTEASGGAKMTVAKASEASDGRI